MRPDGRLQQGPPKAVNLDSVAEMFLHNVEVDKAVLSIINASDRTSTSLFRPASTTAMAGTAPILCHRGSSS